MQYPLVAIDDNFRRLIPSKYPTINVYEKFSPKMQEVATGLEPLTNPRLVAQVRLAGHMAPDTASPQLQNWNHAPFTYPQPEGSRFLPAPYSVMELAATEQGALARAILRREDFLSRTEEPVRVLDMRVICNRVVGNFADLRGLPPETSETARHMLGKRLYQDESDGIIFRIPEVPGCDFVAIFGPDVLTERAVQGAHYRFRWDGRQIGRIYDFNTDRDIERSEILEEPKAAA